ncbi:SPARC [Petromyzon marinus]|uniref:SPARC-like n=1 Tax=Petromyzon marinus TaxID=7757 RepID=A1YIY6_PETMA|nr:SPARC-like [Petromyzon marinus]XP_032825360.1 SPARC-like [Petromyzon marinus]XP_032825361.1 SPARC-like [Petromyzon marinus]ABM21524.1 SPARCB [Petromyzon marinus]
MKLWALLLLLGLAGSALAVPAMDEYEADVRTGDDDAWNPPGVQEYDGDVEIQEETAGEETGGEEEAQEEVQDETGEEEMQEETQGDAVVVEETPVVEEEVVIEESEEEEEETPLINPCLGFACKPGRVCEVDVESRPVCICQSADTCESSSSVDTMLCGTDNHTYPSRCHLDAHRCALDGTKKGRHLHLDYIGPCKEITPCLDVELTEFPLRMRDWLKNVVVQMYERDEERGELLTDKQRRKLRKIVSDERRLRQGDHTRELLQRDFVKNYRMYIYPVHWQFAQLDSRPADRYLSHSELSPLRAPLVPMEHCTTRFFLRCDADGDRLISLPEWGACFGLLPDDVDEALLF